MGVASGHPRDIVSAPDQTPHLAGPQPDLDRLTSAEWAEFEALGGRMEWVGDRLTGDRFDDLSDAEFDRLDSLVGRTVTA